MTFILNINDENVQDYFCLGEMFALCFHQEMLPRQCELPVVVLRVTPSRNAPGRQKNYVNINRLEIIDQGKSNRGGQ